MARASTLSLHPLGGAAGRRPGRIAVEYNRAKIGQKPPLVAESCGEFARQRSFMRYDLR